MLRLLLFRLIPVAAAVPVAVVLVLRWVDPPITAYMLRSERRTQTWVPLARISPAMQRAVIAAEDQTFVRHGGFDVKAIEDALEDNLEGRSTRGASTITQQTAKNLFLWPARSLLRKGLEVVLTVLLEALWPKRRILEVYLNVVELGDGLYGVEAAARRYYGVGASRLSSGQAAALAGVLPSPRTRDPRTPSPPVARRVEWIAEQMALLPPDTLDRLGW